MLWHLHSFETTLILYKNFTKQTKWMKADRLVSPRNADWSTLGTISVVLARRHYTILQVKFECPSQQRAVRVTKHSVVMVHGAEKTGPIVMIVLQFDVIEAFHSRLKRAENKGHFEFQCTLVDSQIVLSLLRL